MPANRLPTITECPPAARALAASPEKRMPPSAMSGTRLPRSARLTSPIAESCGTPTPATTRVVQIEPGPIPTFTASHPACTSACAPSAVATLPAMTCMSGKCCLIERTRLTTPCECPCAVSTAITSTPAPASASTRSSVPGPVLTAAPTRSCSCSSLHASGYSRAFWMSFTVTSPRSSKPPFTTSTFSMRCLCRRPRISSWEAPSRTVTSFSFGVITLATGASYWVSKRRSRLVTMPTSSFPSTTGTPEMSCSRVRPITSRMLARGGTVIGSAMTPLSNFLTMRTCRACSAAAMFLWMMPIPPAWAMPMASRASVTVSMAEDTKGMLRSISRVSREESSVSRGSTSE